MARYSAGGMRSMASRRSSNAALITPCRCSARTIAYTRASQSAWKNRPSSSTGTGPNPVCPPMSCTRLMRPTLSRGPGGQPGAGPGSTKLSQVIDLKAARKDPDHFRAALARRGAAGDFDALLAADASWRGLTERAEALRARQKRSSKSAPTEAERAELRQLREQLDAVQADLAEAERMRNDLLAIVPNLPDPTAADGMTEEDAQTVRTWGKPPAFGFTPKDALDLGSKSGWIDMARGARLSGSRFAYPGGGGGLGGRAACP